MTGVSVEVNDELATYQTGQARSDRSHGALAPIGI
jgi:hypothetical protein